MLSLLFSVLSGVRELSATASLAEFQQPEASPELPTIVGVPPRDLLASLCPIAVAFIVATIRHYNEKHVQQRTLDLHDHSSPLLTFEDANIASYNNCGELDTAIKRRRSETFYVSENSVIVFTVCSLSLNSVHECGQILILHVPKR